jgi:hypothetical protein
MIILPSLSSAAALLAFQECFSTDLTIAANRGAALIDGVDGLWSCGFGNGDWWRFV